MYKLYEFPTSGNCYKVRLALAHVGKAYDRIEISRAGGTKKPEYLKVNPQGKVPALELAPGKVLTESGAILYYLAQGTPLMPTDSLDQAEAIRWLFFEQENIMGPIGMARYILKFEGRGEEKKAEVKANQDAGYKGLETLDGHFKGREFAVGNKLSFADIALYGYAHLSADAGMDLGRFPNVRAWLERMRTAKGHVTLMQ